MKRTRGAWLLLLVLAGCSRHDDIRTRYEIERMIWEAQFYQRRINIAFLSASRHDTRQAIEAYRRVVAADPFAGGPRPGWEPGVAADIRELLVTARVALANLYFAAERYADAVMLYSETLRLGSMSFRDVLDLRMGVARASYMEGDHRRVIEQCAQIFHEVEASAEFWSGAGDIDEVFLNIPVALVRLHRDAENAHAADSSAADAMVFYQRVTRTWPDTRADWLARLAITQLHMLQGEWYAAASELDALLSDPAQQAGDAASLELVLGEIYAFRLSDPAAGTIRFHSVQSRYPGTVASFAAAYNLATLRLEQSDPVGAEEDFRALERARGVPDAVASRAMLARARILEARGAWGEAYALFRRIEELYPFTPAAIEAPLLVTRHFAAAGNPQMVQVAMAHASKYYNSLLDRTSAFPGNRSMVQSALVESFVASGRANEGVRLLATGSQAWDNVSAATGMLRAAELYSSTLNNPDEARATLERVIERFPDTRYSRIARQRLDRIAAGY
jgi:TolA-binding protein